MAARTRYDSVAMTLHWVIALGILLQIVMGLVMVHLDIPLAMKFELYQLHKSVGITILFAAALRILWRLTHKPPALPDTMPAFEKTAASGTHFLLYALMLALPFTGWIVVSVSPYNIPTVLYGIIPWPDLPWFSTLADKQAASDVAEFFHDWLGYAITGFVVLHILAALRHRFWLRDNILRRMLPFGDHPS
jgi:cytochrome b561